MGAKIAKSMLKYVKMGPYNYRKASDKNS